jgi:hypothetical protein
VLLGPVKPSAHVAGTLVDVPGQVALVAAFPSGIIACVVVGLSHCCVPALNANPSVHAGLSHFWVDLLNLNPPGHSGPWGPGWPVLLTDAKALWSLNPVASLSFPVVCWPSFACWQSSPL